MTDTATDAIDILAGQALFADLARPQLEAVVHTMEEEFFPQGRRILRQGFTGSGLYVVLEGQAAVVVDGVERSRLSRGEFFGEMSLLLGEPPSADVVAATALRCLVLPGQDLQGFLLGYPSVMYRMLQSVARRLRTTLQWPS